MPNEVKRPAPGMPIIKLERAAGVPELDPDIMPVAAWFLINEARSCFSNSEHVGCLAALAGCMEVVLGERLHKENEKLKVLINAALDSGIILKSEAEDLHDLRKSRNAYIHFDPQKFPRVKEKLETKIEICDGKLHAGETRRILTYPSGKDKEFLPLVMVAAYSQLFLLKVTDILRRLYPSKDSALRTYWKCVYVTRVLGDKQSKKGMA